MNHAVIEVFFKVDQVDYFLPIKISQYEKWGCEMAGKGQLDV
jgi:hypothetical protein